MDTAEPINRQLIRGVEPKLGFKNVLAGRADESSHLFVTVCKLQWGSPNLFPARGDQQDFMKYHCRTGPSLERQAV